MKSLALLTISIFLFADIVWAQELVKQTAGGTASGKQNSPEATDLKSDPGSSKITIIENYTSIASVQELLAPYKDKAVFIDLWATWCSPCLEEFKFSGQLSDFLDKSKIQVIYISFDKEQQDSLWRDKIQRFGLTGHHIRATKKLQDDLTTLIWGGIDILNIPRYILFSKNKDLINKDLPPPSSGKKLFETIELALEK